MKADNSSPDRILPDLSRRDLFRTAGLATGGAMLLGLPKFLGSWTSEAEAANAVGSASPPVLGLELDGAFVAFVTSMEGGNAFADIVPEAVGPDLIQRKQPGPVRFEDIVIDVSLSSVAAPLTNWITGTLAKGPTSKNGAIVYANVINFNEVKRLEFFNAVLTEVTVPATIASEGKRVVMLTLRITPQSTRLTGGTGKTLTSPLKTTTKNILSTNFRFNVQGLESSCGRISKVDSITAKRLLAGAVVGQDKLRQSAPGVLDCSIVRITLPEADAGPFYAWLDKSIVQGNPGDERAGVLEWLDPTLTTVIASVQLNGLGIVRYAPDPIKAGSTVTPGLVQVDMYCESINLSL